MYAGVDIGGSKTLVAVFDGHGVIKEKDTIPTPDSYETFLEQLKSRLDKLATKDFQAAGVGIPAVEMDRELGIGHSFGNLPWLHVPIQSDMERLLQCPVVIENDAKMAGLSEAMLLKQHDKVLYITIGTGIGVSVIIDQHISQGIGDAGGRTLLLEHKGSLVPWESFASGKAIVERYGKRAEDITDSAVWHRIAFDLSTGLAELIALTQPDVIVVGGGVGKQFKHFGKFLQAELKKLETPLMPIPPVQAAQRPDEAVVYGCYDLAKETYGKHA